MQNKVGEALRNIHENILAPNDEIGSRTNVPKLIVAILSSPSNDNIKKSASVIVNEPYWVTVAVGYGNSLKVK